LRSGSLRDRGERLEHALHRLLDGLLGAAQPHVGVLRRLVRRVDAREAGQGPRAGTRVEAVRVAALALLDRRVDPRLDELQPRLVVETSATTVTSPASAIIRATLATRRACS
jgi:hypothetical protein